MKVIEVTHPKNFRHEHKQHGTHDRNKIQTGRSEIKQMIEILKAQNRSPASIMSNIKQLFGAGALSIARKEMGMAYMEAMQTAPLHDEQLERMHQLLQQPLPAKSALDTLNGILSDDGLNDDLQSDLELTDVRPIIMKWLELNMPHLIHSPDETTELGDGEGIFSPIHGYGEDDYGTGGSTLDFSAY